MGPVFYPHWWQQWNETPDSIHLYQYLQVQLGQLLYLQGVSCGAGSCSGGPGK